MERIPVKSSMVTSIGYDPTIKVLEVEMNNGRVYQYTGVAGPIYTNIMKAESVGKALLVVINAKVDGVPVYPCMMVEGVAGL